MRATKGLLKGLNPTMAMTALTVVTLFLLFGVFDPDTAGTWFTGAKDTIIAGFKWYYILVVALFLFFAVYLMFSRFGSIRLGDDDQVPEFGYFAWFSMLFSAGMGIGLVFWSIAEPMYHLQGNPFITEGMTPEAAQIAMRLTFFHWGLHPWAIYVIVGLSLAFFSYRRKLPLAPSAPCSTPFLAIASTASGAMPPTCWRCSVPCSGWRPPLGWEFPR